MSDDDDRVLLERSRDDPEAFGALFDRHFGRIFGYLFRRTGDWDVARDLTSEVFLKALRGRWRFRWTGAPVASWLYAIATNEVRMHFRRGARARSAFGALHMETQEWIGRARDAETERLDAEQHLAERKEFVRAQAAIMRLPLKYQEVITLRYFEEKSNTEIASILGKREGTIKSLLSRGLTRLRDILTPEH